MKTKLLQRASALILVSSFFAPSLARAGSDSLVTAVYSSVSNGYKRKFAADGSPKPEYYAIANGKHMPGLGKDASMDDVAFPKIAGTVATFLAKQNYLFAQDAKSADFILMITWGTTVPHNSDAYRAGLDQFLSAANTAAQAQAAVPLPGAADARTADGAQSTQGAVAEASRGESESQFEQMRMFEDMRMKANEDNAKLLGYTREIQYHDNITRVAGGGAEYDDLISDIENERYFVIIAAYDFPALVKNKEQKLLWITRVSIQKNRNRFDRDLGAMVAEASQYFGRESGHLIRQYHDGTVTLGELKVVGVVEEPPPADTEPAPTEPSAPKPAP